MKSDWDSNPWPLVTLASDTIVKVSTQPKAYADGWDPRINYIYSKKYKSFII